MTKIGFITTNKVLAQSLLTAIGTRPELEFEPFFLQNPDQAALDVEVLGIDVAVVDVPDGDLRGRAAVLSLCEKLRGASPGCRILLLLPQDAGAGKEMAVSAVKSLAADDFVFYDTSLEYLFAKLSAF